MPTRRPIGIFDSGIGGLSVLRHIRAQLPHEDLLYFADAGYAPYGNKTEADIVQRTLVIAHFLVTHGAKIVVVACNTATAAAIAALRMRYPTLPVVGVEPGLKPAAAMTRCKTVGVLATESTLSSKNFHLLREQVTTATNVRFLLQACPGLATQIENAQLDSAATALLVQRFVTPLINQGADTLVLGCTHYPFVQPLIEQCTAHLTSKPIAIIDTGEAVARQLQRLLLQFDLRNTAQGSGTLTAFTTGQVASLAAACATLLHLAPVVLQVNA